MRNASSSWLAALAALALLAACGENMDADAGADAETDPPDTGVVRDAGHDAGTPRDAGPQGCQTGCALVEVAVGVLHTCARRENGEVICWGRNQELQLGDNRTRHDDCAPTGSEPEDCSGRPENVRFQSGSSRLPIVDAIGISVQGFSTGCAVREAGELWCWSEETVAETSDGFREQRPVAVREADFTDVVQASATSSTLCVIQGEERAVLCFGNNGRGELGNGLFNERLIDPVPVLLPSSFPPVVMLPDGGPMVDGGVSSDGGTGSDGGGLGDGGVDLDAGVDAGVAMEDGGFSTTPLVGALEIVVSGRSFACARTADDVLCWGINDSDQLGDGQATSHTLCIEGAMDRFDCSPYPVAVGGPDATRLGSVDDIDVGSSHACAVQDGLVLCWGDNRAGAAGQPESSETIGLPTPVGDIDDATQVAAGSGHTCALHADGSVSCWGSNFEGQLGDGIADHGTRCVSGGSDVDCSVTPVSVATIDDATFIAANSSHTCVIRGDGSVWCWGYNTNRQLGDGTRNNRNTPVRVMQTPM